MKKLLTRTVVTLFLFAALSSQNAVSQNFQEGDFVINAGIGLGTTFATYGGGFGLPFGAGAEYGIKDLETGSIGIGGDVGYVGGSGVSMTTFGVRGSYYLTEVFGIENDDLDLYAGLGIYYRNFSFSGFGNWGSGVYPGFHAGARYYFADNIGGFAELGNNWGWLNIGVVFKL